MSTPRSELPAESLTKWLRTGFETAFPALDPSTLGDVRAVAATSAEFGDFQCNAALPLAKSTRQPPRAVAQQVLARLQADPHPAVEGVDIAGPGFINIRLKDESVARWVMDLDADARTGVPDEGQGRTVVIDYSSPNVAKPMHIGHIRSTIIGAALDRLHRFLGYTVISDNHLGDWGTQFGIIILGYKRFADAAKLAESPVEELERIYVKSYEQSKADPEWLAECRRELVKLQAGDGENLALWRRFVSLSLAEFDRIYSRLGVRFDLVRGESHYNDKLQDVLARLGSQGLLSDSEGAQVVFLEAEGLPVCIVRKTDGGFNYATTDIATVLSRVQEFNPCKIVYVTDERQQLHFRQVFTVCRKLGVQTPLEHVWFGLMRLPEGTFSTRQGNVIKLERLLDEAEQRALDVLQKTSPDMEPARQREIARAVGIGAVKYADLSQNPQTTITFTWDKALSLEGNSGPYLQYAYARIASVQDKYRERFPGGDPAAFPIRFTEPVERLLGIKLLRFPETVVKAAQTYRPCLVADYLYDLAQTYSNFYQNVPFLKADEGIRESRVRLCGMVARVMRCGLDLLGIETPDRI